MADDVVELVGVPVLVCGPDGPTISQTQDALDVIGAAFSRAEVVAVPVARLDEEFFRLRSGLAGEVMQKFVNYQMRLVVVGDISVQLETGTAFGDLVRESNRGRNIWFVADLDELSTRLAHP